jgi:hypothetical protein
MEQDIIRGVDSLTSKGTAIVLASVSEKAKKAAWDKYPKMRISSDRSAPLRGSSDTLQAGYDAGRNLNINRSVSGPSRKQLS